MNRNPIGALIARDTRSLVRDPFLFFLLLYGALLALVTRVFGPYIPLDGIELYLAPAVVIAATVLGGTVLGFTLVEERETQTWLLFRVLPEGSLTFATYLITGTMALAFGSATIAAAVYGRPVLDPSAFVGSLVAAAAGAPAFMLFLGAYASNKVEALALHKIGGSVTGIPLGIFLLPSDWQWVLWWNPWYWIYLGLLRAYATAAELQAADIPMPLETGWPYGAIPMALCAIACAAFARRYRRLVQ